MIPDDDGIHTLAYRDKLIALEKASPTKEKLIENLNKLAEDLMKESGKLK